MSQLSWQGGLSLRQFNDIDLLVHPDDFDRASCVIKRIGYQLRRQLSPRQEVYEARRRGQLIYRDDRGLLVELHWRLTFGREPGLVGFGDLWSRRLGVDLVGGQVYTFCIEDLMLYLMVHGGSHRWPFLLWLCDCAELMRRHPDVNWQSLVRHAREARCERMLSVAVTLLAEVLGVLAPAAVRAHIAGNAAVGSLADELSFFLRSGRGPRAFEKSWINFRMRDRKRDGVRRVLNNIFDPQISDWETVDLPERFLGLYFLLRPFRLVLAHTLRRQKTRASWI